MGAGGNPGAHISVARVFPGAASGSHTERMVDLLWREVVSGADAAVDVHGGDLEEELVEYSQINLTGDEQVDQAAEALARALDMPFFVRRAAPPELPRSGGTLCQIAGPSGIPAALAEAGSHGILDEGCVAVHLKGLRNVLYHLGMLAGTPSIEHERPMLLHRFAGISAPIDGLWDPSVTKGDVIEKGQVVGEMHGFLEEEPGRGHVGRERRRSRGDDDFRPQEGRHADGAWHAGLRLREHRQPITGAKKAWL